MKTQTGPGGKAEPGKAHSNGEARGPKGTTTGGLPPPEPPADDQRVGSIVAQLVAQARRTGRLSIDDIAEAEPDDEDLAEEVWERLVPEIKAAGFVDDEDGIGWVRDQPAASPGGEAVVTMPPIPGKEQRAWPRPPGDAAFAGLIGRLVRVIAPHSETAPVALLVQSLVAFGSVIGRSAYWTNEDDVHHLNLYALLVGPTAEGGKGTSWGRVRKVFRDIDPVWAEKHVKGGLSSGEGLIVAVRDGPPEEEAARDKRLLVLEAEFGRTLTAMRREGNVLSSILRDLWDTGNARSLTKTPLEATNAHVSLVGHITPEELRGLLTRTDQANGFGNRLLVTAVKRARLLPRGGSPDPDELAVVTEGLKESVALARQVEEIEFDDGFWSLWEAQYRSLKTYPPGIRGAMLSRAAAQVRRLAAVYALADGSSVVGEQDLRAALALWGYCEESVVYVFGGSLGHNDADRILDALREKPGGLTRTEISGLFRGNKPTKEIEDALGLLDHYCLAERTEAPTAGRGRPAERWRATNRGHE
jgi:hypothetical protein